MSRFSGPVEAILSLYEEGKDISYILKVLNEELEIRWWYENDVKYYLKVYKYLVATGQYHVPADVELFEGDIDSLLANLHTSSEQTLETEDDTDDEFMDAAEDDSELEDDSEDAPEQKKRVASSRSTSRNSTVQLIETPLLKNFFKWLKKKVKPNVFSSYKTGLRKVLADAEMDFDEFAPHAEGLLDEYYGNGSKAEVGNQASGAARACVKKLVEFIKAQSVKKEPQKKKSQNKKPSKKKPVQESLKASKSSKKLEKKEETEVEEKTEVVPKSTKLVKKVPPELDKQAEKELFADPSKSFNAMKKAVSIIAKGIGKALFISGNGGIGKTYAVTSVLEAYGHKRPSDYNLLKTKCTPINVYNFLYKNQDKICVFDDCDSVLQNIEGRSVLKSALDSDDVREVFWGSASKDIVDTTDCMDNDEVAEKLERWSKKHDGRSGMPNHFFFNGSVIIISNMKKNDIKKLDEALVTRATSIEVRLTNEEILDRLKGLLKKFKITDVRGRDISNDAKKRKVFDWISSKEFLNDPRMEGKKINFRLFINTYKALYANDDGSDDWKQTAFQI